jgi:hypothetical protein
MTLTHNQSILQLVEQELLNLPEHLSSPSPFHGVPVAQFLDFCVVFFFLLFFFLLAIALTALIRITASDYSFGIFNFNRYKKVEANDSFMRRAYWT